MLIGFVCPRTGKNVKFEDCFKNCKDRCHPLPTLLALSKNGRETVPGVYHVTEIFDPPQVTYLKRHSDFYRPPESLIYVTFGTAFHSIIERTAHDLDARNLLSDYILDPKRNHFEVEIKTKNGKAVLSGTPDLWIPPLLQLWDYKTGKFYWEVKKILEGDLSDSKHPFQLNTYKAYKYDKATGLYLEMNIKDYSPKLAQYGVKPIEVIEIPIMDTDYIKHLVETRINFLLSVEKNPSKLKDCGAADRWHDNIRCREYCDVKEFCVQYKAIMLEEEGNAKKKKRTRKRK